MAQIPLAIYFLLPSSTFILMISLYLIIKNRSKATTVFFVAGILQFFWTISAVLMWQLFSFGLNPRAEMITKTLSLAVFLIPVFLYHFSIEFCHIKNQNLFLYFSYIFSVWLVAASESRAIIESIFSFRVSLSQDGYIYYSFSAFVTVLLVLTLVNFAKAWMDKQEQEEQRKDLLMFILMSFSIFGLVFIYFLPDYGVNIFPLYYLTIPIYALILCYVLIEKHPFATVLTTDILVAVILAILASFIIFPKMEVSMLIRSLIFILISFICFLLVRRTNTLNKQKKNIEKIVEDRTKELQEKTWRLNEANEKLEESNAVLEIMVKARTLALKELNENLEAQIQDRTKELNRKTEELQEKINELVQISNVFINRENKMVELKEKIKELQFKLKEK